MTIILTQLVGHCTALWANWCASVSEAFRGDPAWIPTFFNCTALDHVVGQLPDAAGKSGNKEEKRIYILCYALQENYTNHVALKLIFKNSNFLLSSFYYI